MKKVLFICTFGDFLVSFEQSNISIYQSLGYEVHCAANFDDKIFNKNKDILINKGILIHNIPFKRKPWNLSVIKNYFLLKKLVKKYKFDVLDIHNAVCGVIGRLVGKKCNVKKIVYTPHSFFFFKGCPLKNKIIFKTIEMHMAKYTDLLICLNNEDYESALKFKTRGRAIYVPGVGVDLKKFSPITDNFRKEKICKEFNLNNEVIFVNVGELSKRKNQKIILQALSNIKCIKWKLIIVGIGDELKYLKSLSKELNINNNVIFAGYRNDIADILSVADFFVFSSIQEGLPVALMEAMALNVICIASKIRGNIDLIKNNVNGLLFENNDVESLVSAINYALDFDLVKKRNIKLTMHDTIKNFSLENVSTIMINIYSDFLGE